MKNKISNIYIYIKKMYILDIMKFNTLVRANVLYYQMIKICMNFVPTLLVIESYQIIHWNYVK